MELHEITGNSWEFLLIPEFWELILIPELHGIPTDSGIPNRNHTSALTLMHCDMLEGYSI
jgi:hypothetical protein